MYPHIPESGVILSYRRLLLQFLNLLLLLQQHQLQLLLLLQGCRSSQGL